MDERPFFAKGFLLRTLCYEGQDEGQARDEKLEAGEPVVGEIEEVFGVNDAVAC